MCIFKYRYVYIYIHVDLWWALKIIYIYTHIYIYMCGTNNMALIAGAKLSGFFRLPIGKGGTTKNHSFFGKAAR